MGEFLSVASSFPAALPGVALIVVVGYWLLVAFGTTDVDAVELDLGFGLGGVPATVAASLLIAFTWFVCLAGTVFLDGAQLPAPLHFALGSAVLLAALLVGLVVTRLLVAPLRRLFPNDPPASRLDFVGRPCVIRTGSVTRTFGQAEVTAADGSSAVIQVRQAGQDVLRAGSAALIFDYDADDEFFWVAPLTTYMGDH